jgi:hypothetical protein
MAHFPALWTAEETLVRDISRYRCKTPAQPQTTTITVMLVMW